MKGRILRRVLSFFMTLFIVSLFVFVSISLALGDSSSFVLSDEASIVAVESYKESKGLNDGVLIQYFRFLKSFFSFNWGKTIGGEEIFRVIITRLPVTLPYPFIQSCFPHFFLLLLFIFH